MRNSGVNCEDGLLWHCWTSLMRLQDKNEYLEITLIFWLMMIVASCTALGFKGLFQTPSARPRETIQFLSIFRLQTGSGSTEKLQCMLHDQEGKSEAQKRKITPFKQKSYFFKANTLKCIYRNLVYAC